MNALERFPVTTFPTPFPRDVVFSVTWDSVLPKNQSPEYGSKWQGADFPQHELVYVAPADKNGLQLAYYATNRENQDEYNWETQRIDIGGVQYDAIIRSYLTRRSEYRSHDPEISSAMPDIPKGRFASGFLLFDKQQVQAQEKELNSLFVFEKRIYLRHTGGQTKSKGQENLTPAKFRRLTTSSTVVTLGTLVGATIPDGDLVPNPEDPTGSQVKIEISKYSDQQFLKSIVSESIGEGGALSGSMLSQFGSISTTSESLVTEGSPAPSIDYLTLNFQDNPLGNGNSVRTVETAVSFPVMVGTEYDPEFNIALPYTVQIVPNGTTSSDPNQEVTPIDGLRARLRTIDNEALLAAVEDFVLSYPVRANFYIPKVLRSISVVWNESYGQGDMDSHASAISVGESYSLACNLDDDASSTASLMPEIIPDITDIDPGTLTCSAKEFYLPMPVTISDILGRTKAKQWPIFHPVAHTLVAFGQNGRVSCHASINASSSGNQEEYSRSASDSVSSDVEHSLSCNVQRLPPTIHGAISIRNSTRSVPIFAHAHHSVSGTNFPSVAASIAKYGTVTGSVYPASIAATSPTKLPTGGIYLVDSKVRPWKYGLAHVYAELFDASQLA